MITLDNGNITVEELGKNRYKIVDHMNGLVYECDEKDISYCLGRINEEDNYLFVDPDEESIGPKTLRNIVELGRKLE